MMHKLWGRGPERERLHRLVEAVTRGHGAVALLEGEPGIGKTRLLAEATDRAVESGCQVARAGTDEILTGRPFALLVDALGIRPSAAEPEVAEIARMLAPTYRGQPELEFVIVDRITDLVERRAADRPLVLVCDDLQWADRSSVRVLYRICQLASSTPVLVLLSRRPAPAPAELDRLLRRLTGTISLPLRPLAGEEARGMAAERLGTALSARLAEQVDRAHGNPLFIEGLIDAVREPGPGGTAEPPPASVTEAILSRISWLDEAVLTVLRTATVLGSPFRLTDLALVTGRGVPGLLELLREPVALGVLGAREDTYAFRHDLVREAIYLAIPEPERAGLHAHVGHTLGAAGYDPVRVAAHLSRGAAADAGSLRWFRQAAATVRPHAPAAAVDLLDRAVRLAPDSSPERAELLLALLEARVDAGPLPEAIGLGEQMLAGHPPGAATRIRWALAEARMWQGRFGEAAAQLARLLAGADPGGVAAGREYLAAWHAYLVAWHDPDSADPLVDRALGVDGATADPAAAVLARLADAIRLLHRGRFGLAADRAESAAGSLLRQFDRGGAVRLVPPVICQFAARRFDDVRRLLGHPLWADRDRQQSQRHTMLASMHYLSGEWDDALATVDTVATLAEEQDRPRDRQVVAWVRALVAIGRGELEQADRELSTAEPVPELRCLRALLCHLRGEPAQAREVAATLRAPILEPADRRLTIRPLWPAYLPLCLALGDRDTAVEVVEVVEEIAAHGGTPATDAEGLHARGLLDDDPELLSAAVERYRRTPLAVERAACQEAAGRALARRGHRDDAAARLREAADGFEAITANRDLARVEAALREVGVHRGSRGPRTRPATGWESLTPTERSVADLVAQGLIYREVGERLFISRRTVETHVAHIFGKLGIRSRAELTRRAPGQRR